MHSNLGVGVAEKENNFYDATEIAGHAWYYRSAKRADNGTKNENTRAM